MASTSGPKGTKTFNEDDLHNMAYQAHINCDLINARSLVDENFLDISGGLTYKIAQNGQIQTQNTTNLTQKLLNQTTFKDLVSQFDCIEGKAIQVGKLTQVLSLYNDASAAARIISKDLQCQNLVAMCHQDSIKNKLKAKRRQVLFQHNLGHDNEEEKSNHFQFESVFEKKFRLIPHIRDVLDYKPPPDDGKRKPPTDPNSYMPNIPAGSPGQARMRVEKNPNAHLIQQQTGVSITQGNYMNVGKNDTSNMIPTWQQNLPNQSFGPGSNNNSGQNNYQDHFINDQSRKRQQDEGQRKWWEDYGANGQGGNKQYNGSQYQPPFDAGGGQQRRKDNRFVDQVQSSYGGNYGNERSWLRELAPHVKKRIDRIVEQCGGDVDYAKLEKHARKKGWFEEQPYGQPYGQQNYGQQNQRGGGQWGQNNQQADHMKMNECETFRSGLNQYKEDMKKQKGLKQPDQDNRNNRKDWDRQGGGGGGQGGTWEPQRHQSSSGGYGRGAQDWYKQRDPPEPKDDRSATEKLFENSGNKAGLSGRRRFVAPTKEGGTSYKDQGQDGAKGCGGGGAGGYQPGRQVMNQIGKDQTKKDGDKGATGTVKDKDGNEIAEEEVDERYKNLDPRMVETIENEIMEKNCNITWDDIAGLESAKKTINEIIIWPMLRPDIFKGIRAPPRGIMFFGPPGTGKTLLGKAIAAQSKSTFMSISASTLTSKWVGEGEKMVKTMFAIAAINQPSVVFIDEIDSLLCSRSDADQESSRRIKTEFLVQLDGANTFGGEEAKILIIGATNRPDDLDEAVRRRLGKRLYIPMPNAAGRRQFLERMMEKEFKCNDEMSKMIDISTEDIEKLITLTKGYSGSDLKALSTEAAMMPLREITDVQNCDVDTIRPLQMADFEKALENVRMSVNSKDLNKFLEWNNSYGSFPVREEDLRD